MKYDLSEFKSLILQLNMSKYKKMIWWGSIIATVLSFIVSMLIDKDVYFNLFVSIIAGVVVWFVLKKSIMDSAKKINFVDDIIYMEQEILEDKIVEKVLKKGDIENVGEYYYKDIVFVKQDKAAFYLYLNNNVAIIIGKSKLENINDFEQKLKEYNLLK